jgi:beta-phosphoglucomutase-like phosphatase (HAD superfamily)
MYKLVLFDVPNLLLADSKDVSEYVSESIRNIYGRVVPVDLGKYWGWTSQDIAEDVLLQSHMDNDEINGKLKRYMEDLYYTYYNVAGHDRIVLLAGARGLLAELWKRNVQLGIISGEAEKITRFKVEKAGIRGFFKTGYFGEAGKTYSDIIETALKGIESELGIDKDGILVVAGSVRLIRDAKEAGLAALGVANVNCSEAELRAAGADLTVKSIKERKRIADFATE